jgi:hypothetical protein
MLFVIPVIIMYPITVTLGEIMTITWGQIKELSYLP